MLSQGDFTFCSLQYRIPDLPCGLSSISRTVCEVLPVWTRPVYILRCMCLLSFCVWVCPISAVLAISPRSVFVCWLGCSEKL